VLDWRHSIEWRAQVVSRISRTKQRSNTRRGVASRQLSAANARGGSGRKRDTRCCWGHCQHRCTTGRDAGYQAEPIHRENKPAWCVGYVIWPTAFLSAQIPVFTCWYSMRTDAMVIYIVNTFHTLIAVIVFCVEVLWLILTLHCSVARLNISQLSIPVISSNYGFLSFLILVYCFHILITAILCQHRCTTSYDAWLASSRTFILLSS